MANSNKSTSGHTTSRSTFSVQKDSSYKNSILIIDNYDSFTYNLIHVIRKISNCKVDVYRNDQIELDEIEKYDRIVLSPGPGLPEEAGNLLEIIKSYAGRIPIFGVCLGHQAIGVVFGGKLQNMNRVIHGMATTINVTDTESSLFEELPKKFEAGRYHSWLVQKEDLPSCFKITSLDDEGNIMSMKHKDYDLEGVQFHPESVLTPLGEKIVENWINKTQYLESEKDNKLVS